MNERIRELATKAGGGPSKWYTDPNVLEYFAELIMEEMYDFIMDESANDNGIPDLGKVKEHFGVEESWVDEDPPC